MQLLKRKKPSFYEPDFLSSGGKAGGVSILQLTELPPPETRPEQTRRPRDTHTARHAAVQTGLFFRSDKRSRGRAGSGLGVRGSGLGGRSCIQRGNKQARAQQLHERHWLNEPPTDVGPSRRMGRSARGRAKCSSLHGLEEDWPGRTEGKRPWRSRGEGLAGGGGSGRE